MKPIAEKTGIIAPKKNETEAERAIRTAHNRAVKLARKEAKPKALTSKQVRYGFLAFQS